MKTRIGIRSKKRSDAPNLNSRSAIRDNVLRPSSQKAFSATSLLALRPRTLPNSITQTFNEVARRRTRPVPNWLTRVTELIKSISCQSLNTSLSASRASRLTVTDRSTRASSASITSHSKLKRRFESASRISIEARSKPLMYWISRAKGIFLTLIY